MEFEEHEVTSDQDQDVPNSDIDSELEEETVKLKKKIKSQTVEDKNLKPDKKMLVKDKAAKNFESGILDSHGNRIQNISEIKNKIRRNEEWLKLKRQKKKEKKARQVEREKEREALGDEAPPKRMSASAGVSFVNSDVLSAFMLALSLNFKTAILSK